jgi:hypothetical protein
MEFRIICLPLCYLNTKRLKDAKLILSVVLYGCETWSLTLRKEHRLRLFETGVLWRIFRLLKGEVTGGWRKLHNEGLRNLYSSPNIVRMMKSGRMRWAEHVAHKGKMENAFRILAGKPKGKRPLRRHRHTWEDNIKMNLL